MFSPVISIKKFLRSISFVFCFVFRSYLLYDYSITSLFSFFIFSFSFVLKFRSESDYWQRPFTSSSFSSLLYIFFLLHLIRYFTEGIITDTCHYFFLYIYSFPSLLNFQIKQQPHFNFIFFLSFKNWDQTRTSTLFLFYLSFFFRLLNYQVKQQPLLCYLFFSPSFKISDQTTNSTLILFYSFFSLF